jgi:hypothetical protein
MFRRFVKHLLAYTPYEVRRRRAPTLAADDDEARAAIAQIRACSMVADAALVSLYRQAAHCERERVAGAFVECGTWKGGAVALMALANLRYGAERRTLHLFDSFQGLPEPRADVDGEKAVRLVRGPENAQGRLRVAWDYQERGGPGSASGTSVLLQGLGYDLTRVRFHAGWFQDTVPRAAQEVGPIALLRLDGDWYESTIICLRELYPQVVPGGFVIVDDYGCYEGCRRAVEEHLAALAPRPFLHVVNEDVRYWIKPAGAGAAAAAPAAAPREAATTPTPSFRGSGSR